MGGFRCLEMERVIPPNSLILTSQTSSMSNLYLSLDTQHPCPPLTFLHKIFIFIAPSTSSQIYERSGHVKQLMFHSNLSLCYVNLIK